MTITSAAGYIFIRFSDEDIIDRHKSFAEFKDRIKKYMEERIYHEATEELSASWVVHDTKDNRILLLHWSTELFPNTNQEKLFEAENG